METVQQDITPSMRGILIDWLVEVSVCVYKLEKLCVEVKRWTSMDDIFILPTVHFFRLQYIIWYLFILIKNHMLFLLNEFLVHLFFFCLSKLLCLIRKIFVWDKGRVILLIVVDWISIRLWHSCLIIENFRITAYFLMWKVMENSLKSLKYRFSHAFLNCCSLLFVIHLRSLKSTNWSLTLFTWL